MIRVPNDEKARKEHDAGKIKHSREDDLHHCQNDAAVNHKLAESCCTLVTIATHINVTLQRITSELNLITRLHQLTNKNVSPVSSMHQQQSSNVTKLRQRKVSCQ
jgi:hypothetical protein